MLKKTRHKISKNGCYAVEVPIFKVSESTQLREYSGYSWFQVSV